MNYMLYCIFFSKSRESAGAPLGVEDRPVQIIARNGLSGAYSSHESLPSPADRSNLLAYKKVVESFHQHLTVIPMRYGAVFDKPHEISRILTDEGERFQRLLDRLDGCVEMGVRILFARTASTPHPPHFNEATASTPGPGRAYLNKRRLLYKDDSQVEQSMKALAAACRGWFLGLFTAFREEFSRSGICSLRPEEQAPLQGNVAGGLISLYFLVRRQEVGRFQRRFHKATRQRPERFLLSGPWPAYNFVS